MPKKTEEKVGNCPHVYRIIEIDDTGNRKDTGRFCVRKRIKDGFKWTSVARTFDSFEEARTFSKRPVAPKSAATGNLSTDKFETAFAKYFRYLEFEAKRSIGTLDNYRRLYRHFKFFEPFPMAEIKPKHLDAWIDLILDPKYLKHQNSTRINYDHEMTLLSSFFGWYRNFLDDNFVVPVLKRHRLRACGRSKHEEDDIRFLSATEEDVFLEVLMKKNQAIHDIALFQLHTGARIGEAAAMEFGAVDFRGRQIRLCQHLHWDRKKGSTTHVLPGTKTGKSRIVPLTAECEEMLRRRRESADSTKVFPDSDGSWLHYRSIQSQYDRGFKKASIERTGTHTLRHTFAVRFLEQTKDIHALQLILGHTDLKVTQVYAKYTNESVKRSFQLFRGGNTEGVVPQLVPLRAGG